MNGKLLDAGLLVAWLGTFLIAWLGAVGLGWYNTLGRHDPRTDALRRPWQRRVAAPAGPDRA